MCKKYVNLIYLLIYFCYLPICLAQDSYSKPAPVNIVTLQPKIRETPILENSREINSNLLRTFAKNMVILNSKEELQTLPYILVNIQENGLTANEGNIVDIFYHHNNSFSSFSLIEFSQEFTDPDSGEHLGIGAKIIGQGTLVEHDNNTNKNGRLLITHNSQPIVSNTRAIPSISLEIDNNLQGTLPHQQVEGKIIAMLDNFWGAGNLSSIVLNLGEQDNLQPGDLLEVIDPGQSYINIISQKNTQPQVNKLAEIFVYKVSTKISLALILSSKRPLLINDNVRSLQNIN